MNEKDYNNTFRFTLTQGNILLCEKIFDADKFNPFTRYSIDIRDILPRAITKLQKVLSKKKYDIMLDCGNNVYYDLYHYTQDMIDLYPQEIKNDLRYSPQTIIQQIEEKTIRGVECKIGFYINENPIVERLFYVDGFNTVARWSVDVETYYVTRAYQTRHGIGYMTNADLPISYIKINPNETNVDTGYQGTFRKSVLDLDLLKYALSCDKYYNSDWSPKKLVITCCDQVDEKKNKSDEYQIPLTKENKTLCLTPKEIGEELNVFKTIPCDSEKGFLLI